MSACKLTGFDGAQFGRQVDLDVQPALAPCYVPLQALLDWLKSAIELGKASEMQVRPIRANGWAG